nr:hypothetical protein [Tanacetum cinerariifolium]
MADPIQKSESTEDPIVITDYIGMPTYCGPMYFSEKTLAMLESQPIRPSDIDLSKIKLPTEEMMMDIEEGGGPGYSDETFVNHPNPGMHYVAPPAPTHPSEAKCSYNVAKH